MDPRYTKQPQIWIYSKKENRMTKTKLVSLIVVGTLALVGIGGAFASYKVAAQTLSPQTTQVAPAQQSGANNQALSDTGLGHNKGGQPDGAQDTDLAAALGVTLEQLQTAYQGANKEALTEAVSKGLITQAQADQMSANGLPNRPLREFGNQSANGVDYDALLAKALGITTDQLTAARLTVETTRLDAAVASGQLTQAQADEMKGRAVLAGDVKFKASMQAAFEASVNQAVSDGVITQAQADLIIKNSTGMPFLGGPGGHGGHGGFGGYAPQHQQTSPSTSTGN
jgi:hypothetical protein